MNKVHCFRLNPGAHQTAFMGDYSSHIFSLMHVVGEFPLKEMRTWGQSNILENGR